MSRAVASGRGFFQFESIIGPLGPQPCSNVGRSVRSPFPHQHRVGRRRPHL